VNEGSYEPCFTPLDHLEPRFEHDPPPPVYHVFAETRAQVENSTDPRSLGSYDGNALKALEYVAHALDSDAELIVIQKMRR